MVIRGGSFRASMPVNLVIGCRSYLFGEGLKKLLEDDRDVNTIGIFNEGMDLKEIAKFNPDLILADFNIFYGLPEDFVIDKQIKILLIGDRAWSSIADKQIPKLCSRGVVGILPPGADSGLLKKALKAVSSGGIVDRP